MIDSIETNNPSAPLVNFIDLGRDRNPSAGSARPRSRNTKSGLQIDKGTTHTFDFNWRKV